MEYITIKNKITNKEATNIVLGLARNKLDEMRVERVKKTNSMFENAEIRKCQQAMEIVKDLMTNKSAT
jgi:hypothetical protein